MAQTARTLRPEDEISHYRIVGPLGAGGMGEVYLAQDRTLERNVALKILPPDLVRSEERVRRFVLEAKSASSLSHPNIVTIYEIGQDAVRSAGEPDSSPLHFISMELVSGKVLSTLIHEDKTDLRTLLGYLAQAADGLAKAHAAGIVHRDLKPGNIMVTADGFAKVLDFGLAKLTEKREVGPEVSSAPTMAPDVTGEGIVVGTVGYMSPEQVQGKAVDHRSDIFSFGCILYEAATRRRPFAAETGVETMHRILHDKPTPVEEINDKVPAELRRLIRRCLAKSVDQRLQSMKDLSIELREIVDEYEALSASASSGTIASGAVPALPARRSPLPLWIGAGLVAVAGIVIAWWGLRRGTPQSQPFQTMQATTQTDRGDVLECALSPDGRYLAYIAGEPGRTSLRVRQVATGSDVEVMPVSDTPIRFPSFSPDGNYLFYTAPKPDKQNYSVLYQVPSLGGTPREVTFDVDSRASFSPDGRQIAFWRGVPDPGENRLVLFDLGSGKDRVLATVPFPVHFQGVPAWSPDGKQLACVLLRPAPNLESTIAFFDPATGRRQDFVKLGRTLLTSLVWLRDGAGIVSSGTDLKTSLASQLYLHTYPDARTSRVTNDFNQYNGVSASLADETIAALRRTRISNLWIADASGAPARRITSSANPETSPGGATAADTGTIVYNAPRDRYLQVWSIAAAGGEARPLTAGEMHSFTVRSAAGLVVFDRLDSTGVHVWRMGADGGGLRRLTSGPGEQVLDLSRDGRYLMVSHYESSTTFSVLSTEDGKASSQVTDAAGVIGFSPDGRSVLIAKRDKDARGLMVADWNVFPVEGGPPTASLRLPESAMDPQWAPDRRALTFRNRADPAWNVYRQGFGGGGPVAVTHVTTGRLTSHRWSPDGRRLAFQVQVGRTTNLWVSEADGSRPIQVTQFSSDNIFEFRWMPDSRRLVLGAGTNPSDAVLIRGYR